MTPDVDIQRETTGMQPQAGDHDIAIKESEATQGQTVQPTCGVVTSPLVKVRLRPRKKDRDPSAAAPAKSAKHRKEKHKSTPSKPARPVLYARPERMYGTQVLPAYNMEILVSHASMSCNTKNLQPTVRPSVQIYFT